MSTRKMRVIRNWQCCAAVAALLSILLIVFVTTPPPRRRVAQQEEVISPLPMLEKELETSEPDVEEIQQRAQSNTSVKIVQPGTVLQLLRSVFLFGDSLTAGAYYSESTSRRLQFTAHNWAPMVQASLRRAYCASDSGGKEGKWASVAACIEQVDIRVTSKGFPGKASKALYDKLSRMHATGKLAKHSLVVIMSGTNDVVGMRGSLADAVKHVESMHRLAAAATCSHQQMQQQTCGTVALLPPPFNYSLPPSWYGQRIPRPYCGKDDGALAQRGAALVNLLRASAAVGGCAMSWEGTGLAHDDEHGNRRLWSDCLHPNHDGYDAFGRVVAEHVWKVATGERELCVSSR